jgi:NCAIR mutase (PurE)-related protein
MDCKEFRESRTKDILSMTRAERASIVHHYRTCAACVVWAKTVMEETKQETQAMVAAGEVHPAVLTMIDKVTDELVRRDNTDPEYVETASSKKARKKPSKPEKPESNETV